MSGSDSGEGADRDAGLGEERLDHRSAVAAAGAGRAAGAEVFDVERAREDLRSDLSIVDDVAMTHNHWW